MLTKIQIRELKMKVAELSNKIVQKTPIAYLGSMSILTGTIAGFLAYASANPTNVVEAMTGLMSGMIISMASTDLFYDLELKLKNFSQEITNKTKIDVNNLNQNDTKQTLDNSKSWNTDNATHLPEMFKGCRNIQNIEYPSM